MRMLKNSFSFPRYVVADTLSPYDFQTTAGSTNYAWNSWQNVWPVWVIQTYTDQSYTWTSWTTNWSTNGSKIWPIWANDSSGTYQFQAIVEDESPEAYLSQVWSEWSDLNDEQREERLVQLRQKQQAQELAEQESRRQQWEIAEANERARQLLESVLDEEQQKTYRKDKVIYLTSELRKRYRLRHDGSVHLLDDTGKKAVASFCIHPTEYVPLDDHVAAKVLYLKYAEAEFERIANRTTLTEFQRATG